MTEPARAIVPDIVEEHLEELGYLLIQRRKLLFSPEAGMVKLAQHDERIAAHLDGLVVAGEAARPFVLATLDAGAPWPFAAALRAFLTVFAPESAEFLARLAATPPALHPACREALRSVPPDRLDRALPLRLAGELPLTLLPIAVDAWAAQGRLPSPRLSACGAHPVSAVRSAAARQLWRSPASTPVAQRLLTDQDPQVRHRALWSLALAGPAHAREHARREGMKAAPDAFTIRVLGFVGHPEDTPLLERAARSASAGPAAREALAQLSRRAPVPGEETMEDRWLAAVKSGAGEPWLRGEVPDGFFTGSPCEEALPGE